MEATLHCTRSLTSAPLHERASVEPTAVLCRHFSNALPNNDERSDRTFTPHNNNSRSSGPVPREL